MPLHQDINKMTVQLPIKQISNSENQIPSNIWEVRVKNKLG